MSDNFANNSNMTALMTAIGNKIKAAGHTIYNAAGTALTRRSKLKFTGRMKVTDDSTNGQTIVDDSPEHIDWDDWCAMSPQEQAAVKEAVIDNAPGVDGGLSADLLNLLWENPDPTSAFAAQNITLASSDYDYLLMIANVDVNNPNQLSAIVSKGYGTYISLADINASGAINKYRGLYYVNDTTYSAANGYTGNSSTTNNSIIIPKAIYGIKKTINLKFSAIASDVSTSANKCMLSDGVTSVEDVFNNRKIKFMTDTGTTDATSNLVVPTLTTDNSLVLSITKKNGLIAGLPMSRANHGWFGHMYRYDGASMANTEIEVEVAYIDL